MPVIIDQLDLVDTEPAPAGETTVTAPASVGTTSTTRVAAALRLSAGRAARVLAD